MHEWGKRIVSMFAAGVLALGGLAGCGAAGQPEPTTAKEVYERYEAAQNKDNYKMQMNYDMTVAAAGYEIPITMTMDMDVADKNGHGTMTTNTFGSESQNEVYMADEDGTYVQYIGTTEGDKTTWARNEVDSAALADGIATAEMFEDAQMEKTDDGYKVTVPGDKILDVMGSMSGSSMDLSSILGEEGQQMLAESLKGSSIIYTFDKDCLLIGMTFDMSFEYSMGEVEGTELSMKLAMKMDATLSDYGTVDASTIAVPEEVKKEATSSIDDALTELTESLSSLGEDTEDATADDAKAEDVEQTDKAA